MRDDMGGYRAQGGEEHAPEATKPRKAGQHDDHVDDLVFDFGGNDALDLRGLCLLLTARQQAHEEDRQVWITGLPRRAWHILNALGLDDYFNVLPSDSSLH